MTIQHNITLDLVQPGLAPRIYAVQNDTNSRVVQITLTDKGQPWAIPADAEPSLSYRKSDGTRGFYSRLEEDVEAIAVSGSTASVTLAGQALTAAGTVEAALVFSNRAGERIAAFPFQIQVAPDPAAGKVRSDDYFTPGNAVLFTPQSLSEVQKIQARSNIGVASAANVVQEVLERMDGKPVAWLYGPEKHRLPALPYWDRIVYPYAFIAMRNGQYAFFVNDYPKIMDEKTGIAYATYNDYTCLLQDGKWTRYGAGGLNWIPIWSNYPIYYDAGGGGALFLAESDPEPVYGVGSGGGGAAFPEVAVTALGSLSDESGVLTFSEADAAKLDAAAQTPGPIQATINIADVMGSSYTFRGVMNHATEQTADNTMHTYSTMVFLLNMPTLLAMTKLEGVGWVLAMMPMMA